ncbi:MAG: hypothetical protein ABL903_20185 [Methylococcales bacterium]
MPKKIHMQDQVFDNVKQIMNHKYRMPIQMNIAGVNITLQRLGNVKGHRHQSLTASISH